MLSAHSDEASDHVIRLSDAMPTTVGSALVAGVPRNRSSAWVFRLTHREKVLVTCDLCL
jgi:hypothetical protein